MGPMEATGPEAGRRLCVVPLGGSMGSKAPPGVRVKVRLNSVRRRRANGLSALTPIGTPQNATHWHDPRQYMSDLRAYGVRIR
jgi:di/tricarboxylate transporter